MRVSIFDKQKIQWGGSSKGRCSCFCFSFALSCVRTVRGCWSNLYQKSWYIYIRFTYRIKQKNNKLQEGRRRYKVKGQEVTTHPNLCSMICQSRWWRRTRLQWALTSTTTPFPHQSQKRLPESRPHPLARPPASTDIIILWKYIILILKW